MDAGDEKKGQGGQCWGTSPDGLADTEKILMGGGKPATEKEKEGCEEEGGPGLPPARNRKGGSQFAQKKWFISPGRASAPVEEKK